MTKRFNGEQRMRTCNIVMGCLHPSTRGRDPSVPTLVPQVPDTAADATCIDDFLFVGPLGAA